MPAGAFPKHCTLRSQVVKEYPEGKMSKHICGLEPGQSLECKGPVAKLPYKANMKKRIGMVQYLFCLQGHV